MAWVAIGLTIAAFAYSLYMQSKLHVSDKPIIAELPTASEGIPIPVVFGTRTITSPNITAFFPSTEYSLDRSHIFYGGDMQMSLCHGELDAILDVQYADKSALEIIPGVSPANGGLRLNSWHGHPDTSQEGIDCGITLNTGAVNNSGIDAGATDRLAQLMSLPAASGVAPTLTTALGPKYKGVATAFLTGCSFGPSPYLRPLSFTVKRIHTRNGGEVQWYDEKAEIAKGTRSRQDVWKYKVQAFSDWGDWSWPGFDDSAWDQGAGGIGNAEPNSNDPNPAYGGTMPVPFVGTQLPTTSEVRGARSWGHQSVNRGTKLWLRSDLGPLPVYPLTVQCWHDDTAVLWFNGHRITLTPTISTTDEQIQRYNSTALIPKEYINAAGPNAVAYRVMDGYALLDDNPFVPGSRVGNSWFIYAGIQFGATGEVPAGAADLNPAHIIHEVLTDSIWGMGYTDADLDDAAFRAAADTLFIEGLGGSFVWTQQQTIEDFLTDVLRHISGVLYVDRTTGKFVLKLIRDDYAVGGLPVLDESNVSKVEDAVRKQMGELVGAVTITYAASLRGDQGAVTLFDQGVMAAQGGAVTSKIDYPAITSPVNASKLALRDLRLLASPILTCKVTADRLAATLNIGDAFVLNWPDLEINSFVMRVTELDLGDGISDAVKLVCIEDLFFFPSQTIAMPNDQVAKPISKPPTLVDTWTYVTAMSPDHRDRGMVPVCFLGPHYSGGNTPVFEGMWTEGPDGTMTRNSTGPLPTTWFDGVDPGTNDHGGTSWLLGQMILVFTHDTTLSGYDEKHTGLYIVDDVGGHWVDYGLTTQAYVNTYARMHRAPDYAQSSDYVKDMIFDVAQGTVHGGHFVQMQSANPVLGGTSMLWTDLGASFAFSPNYDLLLNEQLADRGVSPDVVLTVTGTYANGTIPLTEAFTTLIGKPGTTTIPKGNWTITPSSVTVSGGDVGATTTLGFKFFLSQSGSTGTVLFEAQTAALLAGTKVPDPVIYSAPDFKLSQTDQLVCMPTMHTNSTTPVTVTITYNAANAIKVKMPRSVVEIPPVNFVTVVLT